MASTSISVEGMDQIDATLSRVDIMLRSSVLRKAVRKAAQQVQREANNSAPTGSGEGEESLPPLKGSVVVKMQESGGTITAVVRPRAANAGQASWIEFGHQLVKGGTIPSGDPARTRPAKDHEKTGKGVVVGRVGPRPWFRPAVDRVEPRLEGVISESVISEVEKELAKNG